MIRRRLAEGVKQVVLELPIGKPQVLPVQVTHEDLCHPMIAHPSPRGWIFELKHDGFRAFARSGPLPLLNRRHAVHRFGSPRPGIQAIEYIETHGEALFGEIVRHDQEGIVEKRLDAPYRASRQPTWLKIKNKDYSRRAAVEWQGR